MIWFIGAIVVGLIAGAVYCGVRDRDIRKIKSLMRQLESDRARLQPIIVEAKRLESYLTPDDIDWLRTVQLRNGMRNENVERKRTTCHSS